MSRRAILAGILALIGTLALAAILSRRTAHPSSVFDVVFPTSTTFDVIRMQDRFTERTAPKDVPEPEPEDSPVIFFPEAKESDG